MINIIFSRLIGLDAWIEKSVVVMLAKLVIKKMNKNLKETILFEAYKGKKKPGNSLLNSQVTFVNMDIEWDLSWYSGGMEDAAIYS